MKKFFIIAAMAVAGMTTANAQEFKVGAKAGFLMSNVSIDDYSFTDEGKTTIAKSNTSFKPGFHFGAFIEYGFNEKIWVEAGVDYAFQGAKAKSSELIKKDNNGNVLSKTKKDFKNAKFNTQQLNIPLWVKYDINGFRPKVGINLGFLTKIETKGENNEQKTVTESFTPDKKFDFGLGIGAEYNLPMGLFFDATFNLGLTDLSNKRKVELNENGSPARTVDSQTFKNRVFQIGVGYKF